MTPLEYDHRHIWHPYASIGNPPPVNFAKSASGVEIELADGSRLVDAVSSWWCVAHGHNHPAIVEAMRKQSERLCHVMFGGFTHEPAVELAGRIASLAPKGLDKVFFADSGSISVEVSVKMAIQYQQAKGRPSRCKMVALKGGYHGDTACAMALSDPDGMHVLFRGMMPRHYFASKPDGGLEALDGWTRELERLVEEHEGEIAGIICEPVFQAANAMNFYPCEYLAELRRICDERDLVLVYDEIAAGFWRTGPRWAHECGSAAPDVMCIGKALAGGHMTMAATVASERIADVISSGDVGAFMHGPTYMANPLACAAANASLELFSRSDYGAMARRIEGEFNESLPQLAALPNVKGVRVKGAVGIVEVERLPTREDIDRVIDETGVWLRPFSNFIYAMPPLVSDSATVRRVAGAISAMAALPPGPEVAGDFHE
jgi:adenosylmethionine-8-amino-7-oxononanoate aminotransferase